MVSFILIIFVISLQDPYLIAIQRTLSNLRGIVTSSHSSQSVNCINPNVLPGLRMYVCMYVYSIMAMHRLGYGPLLSAN